MMKTIVMLLVAVASVCASVHADVFSNVYFWTRGLATDANGDGILDADEARDSLNGPSFSYSLRNGPFYYTNQWAHLPYRGTTNFVQSIYLPQTVVVTNDETGAGYGYPGCFTIPNSRVNDIITAPKANYTVFIRFPRTCGRRPWTTSSPSRSREDTRSRFPSTTRSSRTELWATARTASPTTSPPRPSSRRMS